MCLIKQTLDTHALLVKLKGLMKEIFQNEDETYEVRLKAYKAWVKAGGEVSAGLPETPKLQSIFLNQKYWERYATYFLEEHVLFNEETEEERKEIYLEAMKEGYSAWTLDW